MFPCSYINVKVPIRESSSIQNHQSQAMTSTPIQKSQPTARALYSFTAEAAEDLSLQVNFNLFFSLTWSKKRKFFKLKENDIITDLQRINEEWLFGRIGSRQGQFPANFVEFITS